MGLEPDKMNTLGYIAKELGTANTLKAIELLEKVNPEYLKKPEVRKYLEFIVEIPEEFK